MYLLFVDESGTHGGNHPFVLGGIAIHEDDAASMQRALDQLVIRHLGRVPVNLDEFELHAVEMRNAKKPRIEDVRRRSSVWAAYPRALRLRLLSDAYDLIGQFTPQNSALAPVLFGVAVDASFHPQWSQIERERFAYEVLLNKFDVMLKTLRVERRLPNRGLVVHDRRVVAEADIQAWTAAWRVTAGNVGQLRNLADVPLFADSRATRLLQVADLVSYALFRRYDPDVHDLRYFEQIWPCFHAEGGIVHGCVHYSPSFGRGSCDCQPCEIRLLAEAKTKVGSRVRESRRAHGTRSNV